MTVAKFKVSARGPEFDGAYQATVLIDRNNNFVNVKPYRRRRSFEMRLEDVAVIICQRIIRAELAEKKRLKKIKRKGGLFGR